MAKAVDAIVFSFEAHKYEDRWVSMRWEEDDKVLHKVRNELGSLLEKVTQESRLLETDRELGFCYTAMFFTDDALLLEYNCGGKNGTIMLQNLKIRRIPMDAAGNLL